MVGVWLDLSCQLLSSLSPLGILCAPFVQEQRRLLQQALCSSHLGKEQSPGRAEVLCSLLATSWQTIKRKKRECIFSPAGVWHATSSKRGVWFASCVDWANRHGRRGSIAEGGKRREHVVGISSLLGEGDCLGLGVWFALCEDAPSCLVMACVVFARRCTAPSPPPVFFYWLLCLECLAVSARECVGRKITCSFAWFLCCLVYCLVCCFVCCFQAYTKPE